VRALRVIGLADDGSVVCEAEPAPDGNGKPERFTLKADDKLRAAARGDLARLGQIEIELESQMRPREIQARIRAGASVEEVASLAGMPAEKVDRFAYPVLLERSRTAELAQRAHPIREDGPDVRTLGEVVAGTFGQRGADYTSATWDSWRGEDGKWVVQLRWTVGRSDNRAHWTFHPGAHGGTVTVLDELAADLIDPAPGKPLRTVRPVTALAEQALRLDEPAAARQAMPAYEEPAAPEVPPAPAQQPAAAATPHQQAPRQQPATRQDKRGQQPALDPQFEEPVPEEPAAVQEEVVEATGTTEAAPTRRGRNNRNNRPIVPSWEDVLLGVRSNRG
jgi:Protein of unknown function (DUF3071)